MFHRQTVFFVACALPLLFAHQLAPNMARELDFWLIWLMAMVLIGLPVLFAEFALSARSAQAPWLGMQKLTREADASVLWRIFAVLSVVLCVMVAANITARISSGFYVHFSDFAQSTHIPNFAISAGLMLVVLILSVLKSRLLPIGLLLIAVGALFSLFDGGFGNMISIPVMTKISLSEWSRAVVLALVSVGIGMGLYWFGSTTNAPQLVQSKKSLTGMILPIWLTQLIFGSLALLLGSAMVTPVSFAASSIGAIFMASFLLSYAGGQLISRFGMVMGGLILLVLSLVFGLLPLSVIVMALSVFGLVSVLVLAIFVGFVMKISHLRKTLNFHSEARYNLWRMLIRIVVPASLIFAFIGLVMQWLA